MSTTDNIPTLSKDQIVTEPDLPAQDKEENAPSSKFSKLKNIFTPAALGAIGGAAAKGIAVATGVAALCLYLPWQPEGCL